MVSVCQRRPSAVLTRAGQQKWSSCSWLLLREFVKRRQEQERELEEKIASGEATPDAIDQLALPKIPYVSDHPYCRSADPSSMSPRCTVPMPPDHDPARLPRRSASLPLAQVAHRS